MSAQYLKLRNKIAIKPNDELIRFIMDYDFELSVGYVKESAFQTSKLDKGLSVSIKRILDLQTKQQAIAKLINGKHSYICDCEAGVHAIQQILLDSTSEEVFDIKYSPIPDNQAHSEILFSRKLSLNKAEKKQYRSELMKAFGV